MKKGKIVTVIIILFIALFALLIAYTVMKDKKDTPPSAGTQGVVPPASGGGQRAGEGQSAGRQGGGGQGANGAQRASEGQGAGGQSRQNAAGGQSGGSGQSGGEQGASGGQRAGEGQGAGGQARQNAAGGQSGGPAGGRQGAARSAAVVQVTAVEAGTIENSVVINGDVLARNQVAIYPTVGGKLVESRIGIGDRVGIGSVVAMVDPSRPGEIYSLSPVISTISGTVLQSPYSIGDTVSAQSALFVVGDLSVLRVETFVPERFVSSIRLGLGATVNLEALPGETFPAEIDEVSPVLDPASRTLRIRLRFVDKQGRSAADPRIKAGMFATISLVTRTRANVPVIPRTSVINTYGSWIAFIIDENNIARRRALELGIENERFFEVLDGISLGDRIVTAGQNFLTDGDPVRIVE
ncbi:MAG: efflux RND transporter periplasmic adaptor subunit [Treponema sp.]|jgi:multidrug efflux pump subunit AcrA (membrane-fusion protein)|nr:efflux RND transporter periplasmic adaptor subunit [Treponema sp.]